MQLMLDTDICIYIIKQKPASIQKHFQKHRVGDIGISSITLSELNYGVAKSAYRDKNAAALEEFIIPLEVLPFDEEAVRVYGNVRAALEKAGKPIGAMDMLIAAHALSLGVPLATNNSREFSHIPALQLIDWTS
jgi:tRNA(fMet)-specific endonuclease VapC